MANISLIHKTFFFAIVRVFLIEWLASFQQVQDNRLISMSLLYYWINASNNGTAVHRTCSTVKIKRKLANYSFCYCIIHPWGTSNNILDWHMGKRFSNFCIRTTTREIKQNWLEQVMSLCALLQEYKWKIKHSLPYAYFSERTISFPVHNFCTAWDAQIGAQWSNSWQLPWMTLVWLRGTHIYTTSSGGQTSSPKFDDCWAVRSPGWGSQWSPVSRPHGQVDWCCSARMSCAGWASDGNAWWANDVGCASGMAIGWAWYRVGQGVGMARTTIAAMYALATVIYGIWSRLVVMLDAAEYTKNIILTSNIICA